MRRAWTVEEDDFLRLHYSDSSLRVDDMADTLNRSADAVRCRVLRLGLRREDAYGDALTEPIRGYLSRADEPKTTAQVEAHLVGRGLLSPEMMARHPQRLGDRLRQASIRGSLLYVGKTPDGRNLYTLPNKSDAA